MFHSGSCNKRRGYYGYRIFYNSLQPNNGYFSEVFRKKISSIPFLSKFNNIKNYDNYIQNYLLCPQSINCYWGAISFLEESGMSEHFI
jgi:hypothetical protein